MTAREISVIPVAGQFLLLFWCDFKTHNKLSKASTSCRQWHKRDRRINRQKTQTENTDRNNNTDSRQTEITEKFPSCHQKEKDSQGIIEREASVELPL